MSGGFILNGSQSVCVFLQNSNYNCRKYMNNRSLVVVLMPQSQSEKGALGKRQRNLCVSSRGIESLKCRLVWCCNMSGESFRFTVYKDATGRPVKSLCKSS